MLFTRLHGQHIAGAARTILGLTDDSARHPAHQLHIRAHKPEVRPAE